MNINEQIAVMQHYANGGKIVFAQTGEDAYWSTASLTDRPIQYFNWYAFEYRIKKEPRKFFLGRYELGWTVWYVLDNPADPNRVNNTLPVEIVEVIENVA